MSRFRWFCIGAFTGIAVTGIYGWRVADKLAEANWEDRATMAGMIAEIKPIAETFSFAVDLQDKQWNSEKEGEK
ncbi:MAG: hypothetical protein AB7P49_10540 [Bdellovibrionales bacterium]